MFFPSILISTNFPAIKPELILEFTHVPQAKLENNPDVNFIFPQGNSIGIDQVLELNGWSSLMPFGAESKLAVLMQAELLTPQAQNSLLKLLEEPPAHTQICLVTHQPHKLLPTVRSRLKHTHADLKPNQDDHTQSDWAAACVAFLTESYIQRKQRLQDLINNADQPRQVIILFCSHLCATRNLNSAQLNQIKLILKGLENNVGTNLIIQNLAQI